MISLSHLNKLILFSFFLATVIFNSAIATDAVDIWKKGKEKKDQTNQSSNKIEKNIKSPIRSDNENDIAIKISEYEIEGSNENIVGIFDPEENDFDLNMWSASDGEEVKKILKRINKLKLSELSENLLFQVLFTNSYPPLKNLSSQEFLKIKIDWLIKKRRFQDLETLLKNNPEVGKQSKMLKFLIDEYLSSANIKSACEKIEFVTQEISDEYLDKFKVYCLINSGRKDEALLLLDLIKERGINDPFFDNKINFLIGITDKTDQKVVDNNLLNFYLSHITNDNFKYEPNDKTDKYILRYIFSANLIEIKDFENEEVILTYEQAAAENAFDQDEIFKFYLKMDFNFNQLKNSTEIYKNLPNYKARALIYQSILLSYNVKRKLDLAFLLKQLFEKDNLTNVYTKELSAILLSIDKDKIPENYTELVEVNLEGKFKNTKKIKFNNEVIHRSKIIKHFLDDDAKISKTEKDFKTVYKKIKRNKKYFISIMDIIVLESLMNDGVSIPVDIDIVSLSSQLTVPKNLADLVKEKQTGLVMLKIIEIIGEDNIQDIDPETIYFLNKILNDLKLKKIRNNILSRVLPMRV